MRYDHAGISMPNRFRLKSDGIPDNDPAGAREIHYIGGADILPGTAVLEGGDGGVK